MTNPLSDDQLRRQMREKRQSVSTRQRHQAAQRIAERGSALAREPQLQHIAVYLSSDGEIETGPLIERLWSMGKQVYLPVVQFRRKRLLFAPLKPGSSLRTNRYNIEEPVLTGPAYRRATQLNLILLPLVAVDQLGVRLGMGGGYYDRTLSFCGHSRAHRKPRLIGLAYQFQKVSQLSEKAWDIPLQGLLTEQGYEPFPRRSAFDQPRKIP